MRDFYEVECIKDGEGFYTETYYPVTRNPDGYVIMRSDLKDGAVCKHLTLAGRDGFSMVDGDARFSFRESTESSDIEHLGQIKRQAENAIKTLENGYQLNELLRRAERVAEELAEIIHKSRAELS